MIKRYEALFGWRRPASRLCGLVDPAQGVALHNDGRMSGHPSRTFQNDRPDARHAFASRGYRHSLHKLGFGRAAPIVGASSDAIVERVGKVNLLVSLCR